MPTLKSLYLSGFSALTLALFLTACGDTNDNHVDVSRQKNVLNGKDAKEYYDQFIYTGTRQLTSPPARITSEPHKKYDLIVRLFADGRAEVIYTEEGDGQTDDRLIPTTWKVDGMKLVVGSVGTGTGIIFNDRPAVAFNLSHDIISEGVKDQGGVLLTFQ